MKFVLACWGSRGDVEPCAAVGRELVRRGHDVQMAVPPDLIGFAESAGLTAVAYGLDWSALLEAARNFWGFFFRNFWRPQELARFWRENWELATQCWAAMSTTLTSLADGADVIFTGQSFEPVAANVAEHYGIPLATMHYTPIRAHRQFLPFLPASLARSVMRANDWLFWRLSKKLEDAQRRELGLPKATGPAPRRITDRGSLEIQAYDEACFPGLAAEWAKWNGQRPVKGPRGLSGRPQRPFVGTLTLELQTDTDEDVASWIAAGTPPIYFGFGSIPIRVDSPADTFAMISAACAQLGERALVCSAGTDFSQAPQFGDVKVVSTMNYAAIFPACRAVVHHGGAGTTAAGLRAGVPTLALWWASDQPLWGATVKRLKVGTARRFSTATEKSLVEDLRTIMSPEYVTRARQLASRMNKPADSVASAADLVEDLARLRRVG
jgi:UDP:flavonoid glycosyltransferase YjiC (YdhE family)